MKKKDILVIGDSHAFVFSSKVVKLLFAGYRFHVTAVKGATVSGLENPNSKTDANKIFKMALEKFDFPKTVIFLLGEVDTGFVIWHRAQKYQVNVEEMLALALKNYETLLSNQNLKNKKIIIISTPLPTIADNNNWGEVSNLRKDIKVPILQRTDLTLQFNQGLKNIAHEKGYTFIDLDKYTLRTDKKGAKKIFHNIRKSNHHYNNLSYASLLRLCLRKFI